jgi:hypothetical protein
MKSCELITYVTVIACFISENCPKEDLPIITAMTQQLADTLRTVVVQQEVCNNKDGKKILNNDVVDVLTDVPDDAYILNSQEESNTDAQEVFNNFLENIFNNYAEKAFNKYALDHFNKDEKI